jgi:DNA-binding NtrC family response regulator
MNARRVVNARPKTDKRKRVSSDARNAPHSLAERRRSFGVLIVDTNIERRTLLADMLEKDWFTVTASEQGRGAAALILEGSVDLVITGVIMPDMDGLELLQVVRAVTQGLPVLVLSDGDTRVHTIYLRCAETLGATKTYPHPLRFRTIRDDVRRAYRAKHPTPRVRG